MSQKPCRGSERKVRVAARLLLVKYHKKAARNLANSTIKIHVAQDFDILRIMAYIFQKIWSFLPKTVDFWRIV